jgi:hypothetical protein
MIMKFTVIEDAILGFMAGVSSATGSEVALVVLNTDWCHCGDGVDRLMPMVAVESGNYAVFPQNMREQVSQYCGALLPVAEGRIEEINRRYGLEPDDADDLVNRSMGQIRA